MEAATTQLEKKLIERIRREGPVTFRDFMQAALYDARLGYYNTERAKIGPAGDYYTSSNVHPAFGAILARASVELWEQLDPAPPRLSIVEPGAGTGRLAFDVLTAIRDEHPAIFQRMSYSIIEPSPAMRRLQQERLKDFEGRVCWLDLRQLEREPFAGIVFSNELIDALPVHRVRFTREQLEELYVTATPKESAATAYQVERIDEPGTNAAGLRATTELFHLAPLWDKPSTQKLEQYVARAGVKLSEAQIIEVNLDAIDLLARLSRAIDRGFLITIDYGDIAAHLYGPSRREGTLRCFYRHTVIDSPFERVGEQDITASVDFTSLIEYGRDFGLEAVSFERQAAFLFRMGLIDRLAAMERANGAGLDDLKNRLAIKNLFVPGGISDNFRVLIQRKL